MMMWAYPPTCPCPPLLLVFLVGADDKPCKKVKNSSCPPSGKSIKALHGMVIVGVSIGMDIDSVRVVFVPQVHVIPVALVVSG